MTRKMIETAAEEKRLEIKLAQRLVTKKDLADFAIQGINATLEELEEECKAVRANFQSGTALGMLETVERKIRSRKLP